MTDQNNDATDEDLARLVAAVDALHRSVAAALSPESIGGLIQTAVAPLQAHLALQERMAGGFTLH